MRTANLLKCATFLFFTVIYACTYKKGAISLPGNNSCDTTSISYQTNIVPILQASCYSCHSGTASLGAGIKLDTYTSVRTYATNGLLLNSILHNGLASNMPKNASKLPDCSINKIRAWINRGSLNN